MLGKIKEMLPEPLRFRIRFARKFRRYLNDFYYDFKQYTKYSASVYPFGSRMNLQTYIIIRYHALEKGLSLKNPRADFGIQKSKELLTKLKEYVNKYGYDAIVVISLNVLLRYHEFKTKHGLVDKNLYHELLTLKDNVPEMYRSEDRGGIIHVKKEELQEFIGMDFEGFVKSRYSIRNYSPEPVADELIERAVSLAMKTPSVCNRQTSKVYIIKDQDVRKLILGLQTGNRGFGEDADKILLITSELGYFTNSNERREPFIGGGMFAMSLVYALHSLELGTCCLNLSQSHKSDKIIKKVVGISDSETSIMLIAVGHIPDELNVASSPRRSVHEVLAVR